MYKNKLYINKNIKSLILSFVILAGLSSMAIALVGGEAPVIGNVGFTPNVNSFTAGTVTLSADVVDLDGIASVDFEIEDDLGEILADCSGAITEGTDTYSCSIQSNDTIEGLDDGNYTLIVTATDNSNNEAVNDSIILTIDNTVPATSTDIGKRSAITSSTAITLSSDDGSGVGEITTYYRVNACASTRDIAADEFSVYVDPFTIDEVGCYALEYYSVDSLGNDEETNSQEITVDDTLPVINSVEVDHKSIDLVDYYGGNNAEFYNSKCTYFMVNVTEENGAEVKIGVGNVLKQILKNINEISGFNQEAYDEYLADDQHNTPTAELDNELYSYWFCPGAHIADLLDYNVISEQGFSRLLTEELVLGEFEFNVQADDEAGNEVNSTISLKITDLTVPLEEGWNLRSTPIALKGDEFFSNDKIDSVLRFNPETQLWEGITDNTMKPLESYYIHATDRTQYGIIYERALTTPPMRTLHKGWNLYGATVTFDDTWYGGNDYYSSGPNDYYCSRGSYSSSNCYLRWSNEQYIADNDRCIGDALATAIYTSDGNRGVGAVIAPKESLSYSDTWSSWEFTQANRGSWVWTPEIVQQGASPDNKCERHVKNFGGFWVFMENDDTATGFVSTPLSVDDSNGDDS